MRRRGFLGWLGGTALWPFAAASQQAKPVVGFLHAALAAPNAGNVAAFRQGLKDAGFVDGQHVTVEFHWAEGRYDRLPAMAADLVRRPAAVILTGGGTAPAEAAKAVTKTIPIVFVTGDDPVRVGLIASLNRPGGNATGIMFFNSALAAKRMELLRELLPTAARIAYLVNPAGRNVEQEKADMQAAARSLGFELHVVAAATAAEIDSSRDAIAGFRAQALVVAADPQLGSLREHSIALAGRLGIPVIGPTREYALVGGTLAYSTSLTDAYAQAGVYAGRILKGEKPAELPVTQPTRFELIVNVKAAQALGLSIPPTLLARADEVIE